MTNKYSVGLIAIYEWWVSNFIPKKTIKFKFEKNFMAMLFAIKNNPYKQILSIVGVSVGDL